MGTWFIVIADFYINIIKLVRAGITNSKIQNAECIKIHGDFEFKYFKSNLGKL
jgi:hypothetical protein